MLEFDWDMYVDEKRKVFRWPSVVSNFEKCKYQKIFFSQTPIQKLVEVYMAALSSLLMDGPSWIRYCLL